MKRIKNAGCAHACCCLACGLLACCSWPLAVRAIPSHRQAQCARVGLTTASGGRRRWRRRGGGRPSGSLDAWQACTLRAAGYLSRWRTPSACDTSQTRGPGRVQGQRSELKWLAHLAAAIGAHVPLPGPQRPPLEAPCWAEKRAGAEQQVSGHWRSGNPDRCPRVGRVAGWRRALGVSPRCPGIGAAQGRPPGAALTTRRPPPPTLSGRVPRGPCAAPRGPQCPMGQLAGAARAVYPGLAPTPLPRPPRPLRS